MSQIKRVYSEAEKINLLERCQEMFKKNKNIWGPEFFEDLSKTPGYAGKRTGSSLKSQARTIFNFNYSKWMQYLPNAPAYGKVLRQSPIRNSSSTLLGTKQIAQMMEQEVNERFTIEESQRILLAMMRIPDEDLLIKKESFWEDVIRLGCIEDRDWQEVMKHFFDHLGDNCSRYLNLQQELKLVDTLSRAKYDDEDDKSVELVNFDNDIDTGIEYEELDDDDEGVEIVGKAATLNDLYPAKAERTEQVDNSQVEDDFVMEDEDEPAFACTQRKHETFINVKDVGGAMDVDVVPTTVIPRPSILKVPHSQKNPSSGNSTNKPRKVSFSPDNPRMSVKKLTVGEFPRLAQITKVTSTPAAARPALGFKQQVPTTEKKATTGVVVSSAADPKIDSNKKVLGTGGGMAEDDLEMIKLYAKESDERFQRLLERERSKPVAISNTQTSASKSQEEIPRRKDSVKRVLFTPTDEKIPPTPTAFLSASKVAEGSKNKKVVETLKVTEATKISPKSRVTEVARGSVNRKPELGRVTKDCDAVATLSPKDAEEDGGIEFVSFAMAPVTEDGQLVWGKMMDTYADLFDLSNEGYRKQQKRILRYYESIVKALAKGAEHEIGKLEKMEPLKNLPRSKPEMEEFAYYHSLAALLFEDERKCLKTFGKGIVRASVSARDSLKGLRLIHNCKDCSKAIGVN